MPDLREPLDDLLRQPRRYTSHLQFPDPAGIYLYDDTLRDGEQMPGVAFSPEQKVELAGLLGDIGIDVADVAFPISSASDRHAFSSFSRLAATAASIQAWTFWRCAGPSPLTSTACSTSPARLGANPGTCRCSSSPPSRTCI